MRACLPLTALGVGALFFLVDPDAELGVTMCNRPMSEDEHAQYAEMPAANRRRKPGSTIDDDEERARRKRTQALLDEIGASALDRRLRLVASNGEIVEATT